MLAGWLDEEDAGMQSAIVAVWRTAGSGGLGGLGK